MVSNNHGLGNNKTFENNDILDEFYNRNPSVSYPKAEKNKDSIEQTDDQNKISSTGESTSHKIPIGRLILSLEKDFEAIDNEFLKLKDLLNNPYLSKDVTSFKDSISAHVQKPLNGLNQKVDDIGLHYIINQQDDQRIRKLNLKIMSLFKEIEGIQNKDKKEFESRKQMEFSFDRDGKGFAKSNTASSFMAYEMIIDIIGDRYDQLNEQFQGLKFIIENYPSNKDGISKLKEMENPLRKLILDISDLEQQYKTDGISDGRVKVMYAKLDIFVKEMASLKKIIQGSSKSNIDDFDKLSKDFSHLSTSASASDIAFDKSMQDIEMRFFKIKNELQKIENYIDRFQSIKGKEPLEIFLLNNVEKPLKKLIDHTVDTVSSFLKVDDRVKMFHLRFTELKRDIEHVKKLISEKEETDPILDIGLPNIGNSCYINAGLQLLQGGKFLEKLLESSKPMVKSSGQKSESESKERVEANLIHENQVIDCLKFLLKTLKEERDIIKIPLLDLRKALFDSKEYSPWVSADKAEIDSQHDGASVIMALLAILGFNVTYQAIRIGKEKSIDSDAELEFINKIQFLGAPESQSLLLLRIGSHEEREFQQLLDLNFSPIEHTNDVENACRTEINGQIKTFNTYTERPHISLAKGAEPPQFLPIKVMRFTQVSESERKQKTGMHLAKVIDEKDDEMEKLAKLDLVEEFGEECQIWDTFDEILTDRKNTMLENLALSTLNIDHQGNTKIHDPIKFPSNGLIDFSKAFGKEKAVNYRVVSFEMHQGESPSTGHYTTYRFENDSWYHFDDKRVTRVSLEEALDKRSQAYILLFEKVK